METRTPDLLITNQLLYQLSYAGNGEEMLDTRGLLGRQGVLTAGRIRTFSTQYVRVRRLVAALCRQSAPRGFAAAPQEPPRGGA